jgi:cytochrome P450
MLGRVMSYLEQFDALDGQPQAQVGLVSKWLRTADWRPFFAELRADRPILRTAAFTLLSRYDDVRDVLSRPRDFSVRLNAPKMDPVVGGPFMLARDATPVNWREKGIMQAVLRPEDVPTVRSMAAEFADESLDAAEPSGRIEAVGRLGRYVPLRMCGAYFGFPGPDLDAMYRWSRATQSDMFKNFANDPAVHEASVRAGEEMRAYLSTLLAGKRADLAADDADPARQLARHVLGALHGRLARLTAGDRALVSSLLSAARVADAVVLHVADALDGPPRPEPQDVFSRLVRTRFPKELGFDDRRILANVAGLLIGAGETTSQAVVQVLRQILSREPVHEAAAAAAADPDPTRFDAYVWEALRLDPINPLLFRFTERDTTVGAGTTRETRLARGTIVFALTASAMSDEAYVPSPDDFRPDRPDVPALHFGFGDHSCLGRYLGAVIVPEVVRRVVRRPGVRLLPSPEGDLDFAGGPFPERFVIGLGAPMTEESRERVAEMAG